MTQTVVVNGIKLETQFTYARITSSGVEWVPLKCDGSDVVDGIGLARMRAWATNEAGAAEAKIPFRSNYKTELEEPQPDKQFAERWYTTRTHNIKRGERVEVSDVVHDLEQTQDTFQLSVKAGGSVWAGLAASCTFKALNVPDKVPNIVSHRTVPDRYVDSLRIEAEQYATRVPFVCGGTGQTLDRARFKMFAEDGEGGYFDFHWHQEVPGSIGPSQHGDLSLGRFGEEGFDSIYLPPGVETRVAETVTGLGANGGGRDHASFHFAQQTPAGEPKNEVFCHLNEEGS